MSLALRERLLEGMKRTRRYLAGPGLIFLYHRIADADSDPWQLAVTPKHFEEHLQVLTRNWRVARLGDLAAGVKSGRLPRRRIVVTFDDGYADNLIAAKPLLEKYDVPATVFIATGYTGGGREFWWDELGRLFIQPGDLPRTLRLQVKGLEKQWELGSREPSYQGNRSWRAWEECPTKRHAIYGDLWRIMQPMPEDERLGVRKALLEWAGESGSARDTHRVLAPEEIIELTEGGLIEAGCHTVTHPQLSALSNEAQRDEIRQSKVRLEAIVRHPVKAFAFPYGRECDYTAETISLVREAGFDYSCTTTAEVVERGADPYRLPRVQATDVDGDAFARLISGWLD